MTRDRRGCIVVVAGADSWGLGLGLGGGLVMSMLRNTGHEKVHHTKAELPPIYYIWLVQGYRRRRKAL